MFLSSRCPSRPKRNSRQLLLRLTAAPEWKCVKVSLRVSLLREQICFFRLFKCFWPRRRRGRRSSRQNHHSPLLRLRLCASSTLTRIKSCLFWRQCRHTGQPQSARDRSGRDVILLHFSRALIDAVAVTTRQRRSTVGCSRCWEARTVAVMRRNQMEQLMMCDSRFTFIKTQLQDSAHGWTGRSGFKLVTSQPGRRWRRRSSPLTQQQHRRCL